MEGRDAFRFAEKCLYSYPENCIRLDALKEALAELNMSASVQGQGYEAIGFGHGGESNPVAARAQKIADLEEEIQKLERITLPIVRLCKHLHDDYILEDSLKGELSKILNLCYFGGNSGAQVALRLGVSERKVYKLRYRLVSMTIRCLGI